MRKALAGEQRDFQVHGKIAIAGNHSKPHRGQLKEKNFSTRTKVKRWTKCKMGRVWRSNASKSDSLHATKKTGFPNKCWANHIFDYFCVHVINSWWFHWLQRLNLSLQLMHSNCVYMKIFINFDCVLPQMRIEYKSCTTSKSMRLQFSIVNSC